MPSHKTGITYTSVLGNVTEESMQVFFLRTGLASLMQPLAQVMGDMAKILRVFC